MSNNKNNILNDLRSSGDLLFQSCVNYNQSKIVQAEKITTQHETESGSTVVVERKADGTFSRIIKVIQEGSQNLGKAVQEGFSSAKQSATETFNKEKTDLGDKFNSAKQSATNAVSGAIGNLNIQDKVNALSEQANTFKGDITSKFGLIKDKEAQKQFTEKAKSTMEQIKSNISQSGPAQAFGKQVDDVRGTVNKAIGDTRAKLEKGKEDAGNKISEVMNHGKEEMNKALGSVTGMFSAQQADGSGGLDTLKEAIKNGGAKIMNKETLGALASGVDTGRNMITNASNYLTSLAQSQLATISKSTPPQGTASTPEPKADPIVKSGSELTNALEAIRSNTDPTKFPALVKEYQDCQAAHAKAIRESSSAPSAPAPTPVEPSTPTS